MRLLENLCCFILFFAEIGDPLGRPGGQCLQGVAGGGSHRAAAQDSFLFAVLLWGPRSFVKCLYVYWFLFLFFFFLIFFSCQGKQWLSREEFPIFQKWWKASACDSFPPPRSCYGSKEACVGNGKEACQSQQPAYYCQELLPWGVCPPRGPRRPWG